jgi:hypothetical protein
VRRVLRRLVIVAAAAATLVAVASPAQAALSVRALWNMNSLPTMVDSAGGDNNGTTRNVTLSGGAYRFNGSNAIATAPDRPNLDPGTANVRLSARISFTQVPASGQTFDIVRKGYATTAGGDYKIELRRSSTGQAVAACEFVDSRGRVAVQGTVGLQGRGFQTVTCTKTSTGLSLTAGGQTRTVARTFGSISNAAPVYIGAKGDGTDWYPGSMDWVKIEIG